MSEKAVLFPVMALIGWTLIVLALIPVRRFKAAGKGHVTSNDFKYGESRRVPGEVSLPNRNFMNLLEAPVLFYVLCILQYVTRSPMPYFVFGAWLYVALRIAHSLIHLTYNNVMHRLAVFAVSNVVLIGLWLGLLFVVAA
ncbi:MAPEG family protein [Methylomicrobium sp. RS1]|jgi:hypothetical protein|uniref:MAPEG family protein n=1 Tax=Candidatus Methylomicrobium oryzae TaxID=2802053 RepID=UPI001923C386|nr:MAPEG family protein [Methylomicrobium sp. RS1]MBL1264793.1 MAPEG family protein [Methylomicrobium sp. RS1]